jgi:glyoxylase-like metal-dependent hydrolase (beta-lactamase superfamily II)
VAGEIQTVQLGNLQVLMGHKQGKYPSANALLIIKTHAHEDHFAGNHLFPEARLLVHENDAPAMSSLQGLMDSYGMPEQSGGDWARVVVEQFHYQPRPDLRPVRDGEVIDLGRTRVHCIHTPGHTGGHMVLRFEPGDVLFLADLDLTAFGPYYGDACSSLEQLIASLDRVERMAAEGVGACVTSHQAGIVCEDLVGAVRRYRQVLEDRTDKLLDFLAEPRTLQEIADRCIVYGKRYPGIPWQPHAEKTMMGMHARLLQSQGRVAVEPDGRYRRRDPGGRGSRAAAGR